MKPLRIAVVGVGHLGRFHALKLSARQDAQLVGVVDPDAKRAEQVAQECQTAFATNINTFIDQIDAAVVAAPTFLHHQVALPLLKRGKHLLIEKPLAPSVAESEELVAVARQHGALLQVGHIERFNPAFAAALPNLQDARLVEAHRLTGFTCRATDVGVVYDLMIHDIDLVLSLVSSRITRIESVGATLLGKHEDYAQARLYFESGCVATLNASRVSHAPGRWMQTWSPAGFSYLDFANRKATVVRHGDKVLGGEIDVDRMDQAGREEVRDSLFEELLPKSEIVPPAEDAISAEHDDFVDSIRTGRAPRVSGEAGLDAVMVVHRILQEMQFPLQGVPREMPHIIPGPHWQMQPGTVSDPAERKKAV